MNYKSRIRKTSSYLQPIPDGDSFYVSVNVTNVSEARLKKIGFEDITLGVSILPGITGSVSRYNANGRYIIHRNLPKITKHRTFEVPGWHHTWHDVTVPYKMYPRTYEAGPEIHLTIVSKGDEMLIISPELIKASADDSLNKHVMNLFLDLFGQFQILDNNLQTFLGDTSIVQVDWTLLPMGEYPWSRIEAEGLLPKHRDGHKRTIRHTDEIMRMYNPEYIAVGNGGFKGYVAFVFPNKDLCIMENFYHGNATYVFGANWEEISKLSKANIIQGKHAIQRIIHSKGWEQAIISLLS